MSSSDRVAAAAVLALGVAPWLLAGGAWPTRVVEGLDTCPELACDFVRHYMPQAAVLAEGRAGFVEGWFYPPLPALLLEPLTGLRAETAAVVWTALGAALVAGLGLLVGRQLPSRHGPWLGLVLVSSSLPVLHALKWGQPSVAVALLVLLGVTRGGWLGGALVGIGGAIKGYPLVYASLPVVRRRWRPLVGATATFTAVGVLLPCVWLGQEGTLAFFRNMAVGARSLQAYVPHWGGQALRPTLYRWFVRGDSFGPLEDHTVALLVEVPEPVVGVIGVCLVIAVLGASAVSMRQSPPLLAMATGVAAVTLSLAPGWHHYFAFLPFLQVVAWQRGGRGARAAVAGSVLVERLPVLGLAAGCDEAFFVYSSYGGTTVATVLVWYGCLRASRAAHAT